MQTMEHQKILNLLNEAGNPKFVTRKYANILVMGDITVIAVHGTQVGFQNCASFTKCLTKID